MDNFSKLDGWFSAILAAVITLVAGLRSFFGLKNRVEVNERDIRILKDDHDKRLEGIEHQIIAVRNEVRQDIKDVGALTEKRHDTLESLIRTVIAKVQ